MRWLRRLTGVALLCVVGVPSAQAVCVCQCLNGLAQSVCTSTLDVPPFCPAIACSFAPPPLAVNPAPFLPQKDTRSCQMTQIYNPNSGRYEWRELCR
jgi:hypothetical protein